MMAPRKLRLACTSSIGAALLAGSALGLSATASAAPGPHFRNCDQAKAAGYVNIHIGQPGYSPGLDRNHNGIACEVETGTGGNTHATTPAPMPVKTKPVSKPMHSMPAMPVMPPAPHHTGPAQGPKIQTDGPASTTQATPGMAIAEGSALALSAGGVIVLMRRRSSQQ